MRGGSFYLTGNQVYWLAGLLEAEGSFVGGCPSEPRTPTVAINMTDLDVLQAVAHLWGSTVASRQAVPHHKMMYRTALRGGSAVALMQLIQPLMGTRRQQQIARAIACHQPKISYPHRVYHLIDDTLPAHERYWLAGYLEGEGCFGMHTTKSRGHIYHTPHVQLKTTDEDIAQHVQMLWRMFYQAYANLGCYQPSYPGSKVQYHLSAKGIYAHAIMADLYPLLFSRRQAKIREVLTVKPLNHTLINKE